MCIKDLHFSLHLKLADHMVIICLPKNTECNLHLDKC